MLDKLKPLFPFFIIFCKMKMAGMLILVYSLLVFRFKVTCLSSNFPSTGDRNCLNSPCECCIDQVCERGLTYDNECTKGCINGHRGARCYELCTHNCTSCKYNRDVCESCYDGYFPGPGRNCRSKCPPNCKTCSSGAYCSQCDDGFHKTNDSFGCEQLCPTKCICNQTECVACKRGYYDTANSCNYACPVNCLTCISSEKCDECQNGFYNGYDIDNDTLSNNCSYQCSDTCKSCSSYDFCLTCPAGKYGFQCQKDCSSGCKNNTCLINTGECNCSSHFSGDKCTECAAGRYGQKCDKMCPPYCKNDVCNRLGGKCNEGCKTKTITGERCDSCVVGRYGELCDKFCPENCKNKKCKKDGRACSEGCEQYFNGTMCSECVKSKYGETCRHDCPRTCKENICNEKSGNCLSCIGNFDGYKCNICKAGFYGKDCEKNCPINCVNDTCNINEGECRYGCKISYSGDRCCIKSENCLYCSSDLKCRKCKSGFYHNSCEARCPKNCLGSCEFSTGVCDECVRNHFGAFCNWKCSEYCTEPQNNNIGRCASHNGACVFGCKNGYFGPACSKTCSSLCIDNVCMQETGICVKGCRGVHKNVVCSLTTGTPHDTSEDNFASGIISVVLGTTTAVSVTVICVLFGKKIIKSKRQHNKHKHSGFRVKFENAVAKIHSSETEDNPSADEVDVDFETFENTFEADAQEYNDLDPDTREVADNSRENYMNLQIGTSI